ncbi:Multiple RNA-binding domain-containing protein 1 [Hanseniaspora vineae]
MSRVIVKNLPKYLEEPRLKEHFLKRCNAKHKSSANNLITDVKIMRDRNGDSRKFAFIGYLNEEDALDAVQYFNNSFIDTAKLFVSMAKSFVDPRVPQPMREKRREALKRLREKEEDLLNQQEQDKKKLKTEQNGLQGSSLSTSNIDKEMEKNRQLKEFMETMNPNKQNQTYEEVSGKNAQVEEEIGEDKDDDVNPLLATVMNMNQSKANSAKLIEEHESDDEYVDLDKSRKADGSSSDFEDNEEKQEEQFMSLDNFGKADDGLATNEEVSDMDWLKNRRVRIRDGDVDPVNATRPESEEMQEDTHKAEEELPLEEEQEDQEDQEEKNLKLIRETGRLFLRNISYTASEKDFRQLFAPYGNLQEVHIALDTRTGKSKGFAYILFEKPDDAVQAYIDLDKQIFQGRLLHILPGESKKSHTLNEFDLKNMPLKKQRELKRKHDATKSTFSWNSLYMSQDAVLASVASKLGMQKNELIDAENSGSAVKQALAEASVIGDVRKYFEDRGVDLKSFSKSERDDTVLLIKNFPFGTTKEELAELFLPFGKLERLLMPPAGTIAILQFRDKTSARAAFSKLSYKRFKDGILYLEKGPKDCFTRNAENDEIIDADDGQNTETVKEAKKTVDEIVENKTSTNTNADDETEVYDGPTVSIFVKNLNFSTTSQQLTDKFSPFTGFVVAQVKNKPDPKNSSKTLSMGFGFVEFRTKEQASAVISAMDGSVIEGHKIQLKMSHRQGTSAASSGKGSGAKKSKKKPSSKIIVKNLPFEATRKDVFELFSSFGQLKSVRVPKKFDKSARGFAFVEFLLPKEAENAMDQLEGVHLLGRRLVMQYAEAEAESAEAKIDKMTQRAKKQMNSREMASMRNSGKGKFNVGKEDDDQDGMNDF